MAIDHPGISIGFSRFAFGLVPSDYQFSIGDGSPVPYEFMFGPDGLYRLPVRVTPAINGLILMPCYVFV